MARGRPTVYTEKLGLKICRRIAEGELITAMCSEKGMPSRSTIALWEIDGKHAEFSDALARARKARADYWAEEMVEIGDDGSRDYKQDADGEFVVDHDHIQRSKLRVDLRRFLTARHDPDRYGDRQTIDLNARGEKKISEMTIEEIREEMARLMDEQQSRVPVALEVKADES